MINLIPPAGHKAIRTEYFMRVGATYCLLFAVVAILLMVGSIGLEIIEAVGRPIGGEDLGKGTGEWWRVNNEVGAPPPTDRFAALSKHRHGIPTKILAAYQHHAPINNGVLGMGIAEARLQPAWCIHLGGQIAHIHPRLRH